jgi:hypothetical protein
MTGFNFEKMNKLEKEIFSMYKIKIKDKHFKKFNIN